MMERLSYAEEILPICGNIDALAEEEHELEALIKRLGRKKENPQKLTQLSSRSHPRHPVGKKDSTKRYHHRHHKRQPGEQQLPIQVSTKPAEGLRWISVLRKPY